MTARDIVLSAAGATPAQGWQLITLTGTVNTNQVLYGNGYYVAIGTAITRQPYSTDAKRWFPSDKRLSSPDFTAGAFGNGTFVAVGGTSSGIVSTMTDPTVGWTRQTTPSVFSAVAITDVAFGAGLFVAISSGGLMASSPDGITWTTRTSGLAALTSIRYSNSLFLGVSGTNLITSPDGITWTLQAATPGIRTCVYGNGYYGGTTGGQYFYRSADLITWDGPYYLTSSIFNYAAATNGTGTWIASGNANSTQLKYSTDNGVTWNSTPLPQRMSSQPMLLQNGPTYINNRFFALGYGGSPSFGAIVSSADGINWIRNFNAGGANVSYINNKFWLGGGGNGSYMVFDPVTTVLEYVNVPQPLGVYNFAVYFNGLYFIGGSSAVCWTIPVGYDYQNSLNWTARNSTAGFGFTTMYSAAIDGTGTVMVIVGNTGTIASGTDGINFTARTSGTTSILYAVAWFNNKFVAVGAAGTLVTSTDGTTWTLQTAIAALTFRSLAVAPAVIMACTDLGVFYTSTDGITWAVATSPFAGSNTAQYAITYGKGKFYTTTYSSASIYSSSNSGANWTRVDSPQGGYPSSQTDAMLSIGYGGGYLAVVTADPVASFSCNTSYYQAI